MNRTLIYQIDETGQGLRIEQYLRRQGYSRQNLTELKKTEDSVQLNGAGCILKKTLSTGDELTVRIEDAEFSEKILPTKIPVNVVYEDEDLLVVNKPGGHTRSGSI